MQVVKGNLHLTNWKRRQGCRCAGLREIVDWCGCSPLAFRSSDISKFSIEVLVCMDLFLWFGPIKEPELFNESTEI